MTNEVTNVTKKVTKRTKRVNNPFYEKGVSNEEYTQAVEYYIKELKASNEQKN